MLRSRLANGRGSVCLRPSIPRATRGRTINTTKSTTRISQAFTAVALIEAFTWVGLLVGMFAKYVTETTEAGVWLFGRLHGAAFIAYVAVAVLAAVRLRWPWWIAGLALVASFPPLTTLVVERWLRRTGRLGHRTPDNALVNAAGMSATRR